VERETNSLPCLQSLDQEFSELVGPDVPAWRAEVLAALQENPDFQHAHSAFHRILDNLTDAQGVPVNEQARQDLGRVRAAFGEYTLAWKLHYEGVSTREISAELGSQAVRHWLRDGRLPQVLHRKDPEDQLRRRVRVEIPQSFSPDFAFVLGAFAGTSRRCDERLFFMVQHKERAPLERLCQALRAGCGVESHINSHRQGNEQCFYVHIGARSLVQYIVDSSCGNTSLPWQHLLTSEERKEFLKGFFSFGGGSVLPAHHRFRITRGDNPALMEELAVLLKREGVYPRVRTQPFAVLLLDNTLDIEKFLSLEVMPIEKLRVGLEQICATRKRRMAGPAEYFETMRVASKLEGYPDLSGQEIKQALGEQGIVSTQLPITIERWLAGKVPASVVRLRALEELESGLMQEDRIAPVSAALRGRLAELHFNPIQVMRAVAEWLGSVEALSERSAIASEEIALISRGEKFPTQEQYAAVLKVAGLPFDAEIEQGYHPHGAASILALLEKRADQAVFREFPGAVMSAVHQAFLKGEDGAQRAQEKVAELRKRWG